MPTRHSRRGRSEGLRCGSAPCSRIPFSTAYTETRVTTMSRREMTSPYTVMIPDSAGAEAAGWKAAAIAAFQRRRGEFEVELREGLVQGVRALTGRVVPPHMISIDHELQTALVVVDGISFRRHRERLVLLRACVYCGGGQFESLALRDTADLGYALAAWKPRYPGCQAGYARRAALKRRDPGMLAAARGYPAVRQQSRSARSARSAVRKRGGQVRGRRGRSVPPSIQKYPPC